MKLRKACTCDSLEEEDCTEKFDFVFTITPGVRDIFTFGRGVKLSLHKKSNKGNLGSDL